ncbi:hypothetical protein K439DRAFT_1623870 [Ramaria rubella]|nr:hypothetical protein K439DRAFT_1623870 [Ramaria rubella]
MPEFKYLPRRCASGSSERLDNSQGTAPVGRGAAPSTPRLPLPAAPLPPPRNYLRRLPHTHTPAAPTPLSLRLPHHPCVFPTTPAPLPPPLRLFHRPATPCGVSRTPTHRLRLPHRPYASPTLLHLPHPPVPTPPPRNVPRCLPHAHVAKRDPQKRPGSHIPSTWLYVGGTTTQAVSHDHPTASPGRLLAAAHQHAVATPRAYSVVRCHAECASGSSEPLENSQGTARTPQAQQHRPTTRPAYTSTRATVALTWPHYKVQCVSLWTGPSART